MGNTTLLYSIGGTVEQIIVVGQISKGLQRIAWSAGRSMNVCSRPYNAAAHPNVVFLERSQRPLLAQPQRLDPAQPPSSLPSSTAVMTGRLGPLSRVCDELLGGDTVGHNRNVPLGVSWVDRGVLPGVAMAVKVYKAGELSGNDIILAHVLPNDAAGPLTAREPVDDPSAPELTLTITIGEGAKAKDIKIDCPAIFTTEELVSSNVTPLPISDCVVLFRGRFIATRKAPRTAKEEEEFLLRAKELVYREDSELASLRSYVANMEAAAEFQRTGPKRDPIPDDVKLVVWARDAGACIRCGSKGNLQFDHVIPVALGGSGHCNQHSNSMPAL